MSRSTVLVVAVAGALVAGGGAAAVALGRARERGRLRLGDLVVGGIAAGSALALVALAVGPSVGLDVWGLIHVAYRLVFLGIPVAGMIVVGALVATRRRGVDVGVEPATATVRTIPTSSTTIRAGIAPTATTATTATTTAATTATTAAATTTTWAATRPARAVLVLAVLLAPVGVWSSHVAPDDLEVVRHQVRVADRHGEVPVRVGVLSDLQTTTAGPHEHEAVDRLLAERPDVILVPGDVFQGTDAELAAELEGMRSLLGRLRAPGGVYVVPGDVDAPGHLDALLAGTDARLLQDEVVRTGVGDRTITIAGLALDVWSARADAVLAGLDGDPDPSDVRIVVAHRPDAATRLRGSRVDLVVAGHTHGGQVALPFIGPPLTLTEVPRPIAAGGLHTVGGTQLFVSKGVGMERGQAPPVRFGVTPDVAVLTIEG